MKKILIFILGTILTFTYSSNLRKMVKAAGKDISTFLKDKTFDEKTKKNMILGRLRGLIPPVIPELQVFALGVSNENLSLFLDKQIFNISEDDRQIQKILIHCIELKIQPRVVLSGYLDSNNPRITVNLQRLLVFYLDPENQIYIYRLLNFTERFQALKNINAIFISDKENLANKLIPPTPYERSSYRRGLEFTLNHLYNKSDEDILDEDEQQSIRDLEFKTANHKPGPNPLFQYAGQKRSSDCSRRNGDKRNRF